MQSTGSVEGCETGTLVITESGILDPATGGGSGTWTITAGQGTGDLAQVSGTLSGDSRIDDVVRGAVRCS